MENSRNINIPKILITVILILLVIVLISSFMNGFSMPLMRSDNTTTTTKEPFTSSLPPAKPFDRNVVDV